MRFLAQILVEKIDVFFPTFGFSGSVSAKFRNFVENDMHRGQPLPKFLTAQTIWHVSRVFRFLAYLVQKQFYLENGQKVFRFCFFHFQAAKSRDSSTQLD